MGIEMIATEYSGVGGGGKCNGGRMRVPGNKKTSLRVEGRCRKMVGTRRAQTLSPAAMVVMLLPVSADSSS